MRPIFLFLLLTAAACAPDAGLGPEALAGKGRPTPPPPPPPPPPPGGTCDFDPTEAVLTGPGWTRVFSEDFGADLSQWSVWNGGAYNEELQLYQAGNLTLSAGVLSIAARRENVVGPTKPWDPTPSSFGYTSGRIESVRHFSASTSTPRVRFSARLRLPEGYGMWPAFWTYGDPWPTQGEIDIVEARGNEPMVYHTAYWYGRRAGVNTVQNSESAVASAVSLTSCWHVYEVIWSQAELTYLFDGTVVARKSGGSVGSMFRKSQRITLNLAVGGLFFPGLNPGAIQTGTLQADWVKVFTAP